MKPVKAAFSSIRCGLALLGFFLILNLPAKAQSQEKVILKDVRISGNLRVEDDGIRLHLKSRPGELFNSGIVEQDVKAIFRMGFFDDVQAELSPDGVLTYAVKEKPYVRELKVQGASQVSREKVEAALGVSPRTILDRAKVAEGVEKVRKLYSDQGYVNAAVDFAVTVESNNQAVVALDIVEGGRLLIKKISFEGNKAFSASELKDQIATKEEWVFSFITNRGVLDRDMLTNDVAMLSQYYNDNGYVEHKVDDPVVLRARDGLEVVFRVHEGPQYRVGKVEIGGELIQDGRQMLKSVKLTTGQIFRGKPAAGRYHDVVGDVFEQGVCLCPGGSRHKYRSSAEKRQCSPRDHQGARRFISIASWLPGIPRPATRSCGVKCWRASRNCSRAPRSPKAATHCKEAVILKMCR